jgi:hypothetical protein
MKRVLTLCLSIALTAACGCGKKDDLNKDLKPIDPNTPQPKPATDSPGGKKQTTDAPAPVLK